MDASKRFVLIVGNSTNTVTAGSCVWCDSYNNHTYVCAKGHSVDFRSYIKYECDKAVDAGIKVIILYKAATVNKSKCPVAVKDIGVHAPMRYHRLDGKLYWDYDSVKKLFSAKYYDLRKNPVVVYIMKNKSESLTGLNRYCRYANGYNEVKR